MSLKNERTHLTFVVITNHKSYNMSIEWIAFEKKYRIKNHITVKGGFYVCSGHTENVENHPAYPFAIDISRDVHIRQKGYGSFHSWQDMTPDMRYDYIRWLSNDISIVELEPSLFYYYIHGICHRLFLDSSVEEKHLILEHIEWMYTEYLELQMNIYNQFMILEKKDCNTLTVSFNEIWLKVFDNLIHKLEPDTIDEKLVREIASMKDHKAELERLKTYLHNITNYMELLDELRTKAYCKYVFDEPANSSYERLLQLSGEKYDEDEVYELRAFIPETMNAEQAFALAVHLGLIDMFATTRLRLGIYETFVRNFNYIYPQGLEIFWDKTITDITLPIHMVESLYLCTPYKIRLGGDLFDDWFNADMLFHELQEIIKHCNENVDEDFWAYTNAMERSKGIITLYSLLCLPVGYDLMYPDIKTFFNLYFDILFKNEKCVCIQFKQFLHLLGYRFVGFEDRLKYYKARRLVDGLAQFGVRIYMDMTSIETGEIAQGRSLKFEAPCTIWRLSGTDKTVLDKDYFDAFKRICVFILDSGSDSDDIQIIRKFISRCKNYDYRMGMKAVLDLYMLRTRKVTRKVWKDKEYRIKSRNKLETMLNELSQKLLPIK